MSYDVVCEFDQSDIVETGIAVLDTAIDAAYGLCARDIRALAGEGDKP